MRLYPIFGQGAGHGLQRPKPVCNRPGKIIAVKHETASGGLLGMASTAIDLIRNPALIEAAKADLKGRLDGTQFVNPIPNDVQPPLPEKKASCA